LYLKKTNLLQPVIIALQDERRQVQIVAGRWLMAAHRVPHFQNDAGSAQITIGVKTFMCCGASEPHDHPHVYLDMGKEIEIVCPYCSTLFRHSAKLKSNQSEPQNCLFEFPAA